MAAEPDRRIRFVADGFNFLEAPRWREGDLYFSDFFAHTVHSMDSRKVISNVCQVRDTVGARVCFRRVAL